MNKAAILVLVGCAISVAIATPPKTIKDLKSLSVPEKLALVTLSSLKPDKYGSITLKSLFSEDDYPWVDYFFVDIRSLIVQSIKVGEDAHVPEIGWSYRFEFCIWNFCIDDTLSLTSDSTFFAGQKRTTSTNEVTPTSFRNNFHAPLFVWHSPNFLFNVTDNINNDQYLTRDASLYINNLQINTTFEYGYVEDLGLQISNLSVDFNINYMRFNIENITTVYSSGEVELYDPIKTDYTEYLLSDWEYYKDDYLPSLMFRINCVLSGSRNDPERCEKETTYMTRDYHRMNVLQLFATIGLGSLDRY
ncbi:unnamed protein product [Orchesella dallaii]|uniref:Uncharacterized protein n=1 Tax=Orchesella dallaii TaxID=48710 RepID=A0ABP1Q684_9HEXA